ncbi:MAG: hypothetical protein QOD71_2012 [Thermoleophilaceae bacterium]|jgi:hypothetical protein|nr:hypothetical protein [Thermoleophilaceae bacterium]
MDWPGAVAATEEIEIQTSRGQDAPARRTTIWAVVDDGEVYVRSVRGDSGRWYREIVADPEAAVLLDGESVPVRAVPTPDAGSVDRMNAALRHKYGDSSELGSMLRDDVLHTTLRLERR